MLVYTNQHLVCTNSPIKLWKLAVNNGLTVLSEWSTNMNSCSPTEAYSANGTGILTDEHLLQEIFNNIWWEAFALKHVINYKQEVTRWNEKGC